MEYHGRILNGIVELDGHPTLPEGASVTVLIAAIAHPPTDSFPETTIVCEPGKLPYVFGGIPGTWQLSNELMEQVLEVEDSAITKGMMIDPS